MAAERRKRSEDTAGADRLQMTPMIDVVFQLLIYFVVTIKPMDVAAHLDVFRPSATKAPKESAEPPKMIRIEIFQGALVMNGRSVDIDGLTNILEKLAGISKSQTVMIMCARDSEHDQLIQVLDRCAKTGMNNLSVLSMN